MWLSVEPGFNKSEIHLKNWNPCKEPFPSPSHPITFYSLMSYLDNKKCYQSTLVHSGGFLFFRSTILSGPSPLHSHQTSFNFLALPSLIVPPAFLLNLLRLRKGGGTCRGFLNSFTAEAAFCLYISFRYTFQPAIYLILLQKLFTSHFSSSSTSTTPSRCRTSRLSFADHLKHVSWTTFWKDNDQKAQGHPQ